MKRARMHDRVCYRHLKCCVRCPTTPALWRDASYNIRAGVLGDADIFDIFATFDIFDLAQNTAQISRNALASGFYGMALTVG